MERLKRSYASDPRPPKRIKAYAAAREKVQREGCRLCGRDGRLRKVERAPYFPNIVTRHHVVPRSLGGDDIEDNIVGLCGHGTAGCHGLIEAHDPEARAQLRSRLTDAELNYVIAKKGEAWLERYLPATGRTESSG